MRSSTISNVAFLVTSLLVNDAFAAPTRKRDVVVAEVDVTQVVTVLALPDGSFSTELGPLSTNLPPAPASTPASEPAPAPPASSSSSSSAAPAEKVAEVTAPAPAPAPAPTSEPAPAPTSSASPTSSAAPAPASSSSSSAAAASTSSSTSTGTTLSSKRGLAYNYGSLDLISQFTGGKASWAYSWGATSFGADLGNLEFVPMLHDLSGVSSWAAAASGASYILGFNEPDQDVSAGGSAISPQDAATAYQANFNAYYGKAKCGAPAVSNGLAGGPSGVEGINWLAPFFAACTECKFDFIPFHWYGVSVDDLKTQIEAIHTATANIDSVYKNPATGKAVLWLTEFGINGGQGNPDVIKSFLAEALPFLDSEPTVERYAYQFVSDGFLATGTTINDAGTEYISE